MPLMESLPSLSICGPSFSCNAATNSSGVAIVRSMKTVLVLDLAAPVHDSVGGIGATDIYTY